MKTLSKNNKKKGRPVEKDERMDEILKASMQIVNQRGIGEINLQSIADQLGLKYTTLYHYFNGRDALGKATYLRSYAKMEENLVEQLNACGPGLERILEFVQKELEAAPESRVKGGYIGTLSSLHRNEILLVREKQISNIMNIIHIGQRDGSIRPLDARTASISILCIFDRFNQIDVIAKLTGSTKATVISTIIDVLNRGILTDCHLFPNTNHAETDIQDIIGWRVDPEDKDRERLELLLRTAIAEFNAKGAMASIPDMAKEIDLSKTAFYQLFVDKQDLLMQCYIRAIDLVEACYVASERRYDCPMLQNFYKSLYLYQAHGSLAGPISCFNAMEVLKSQHQRLIRIRNSSARIRAQARLQMGIDKKLFRDVDPGIVQPMIGGLSYALPAWYEPDYHLPLEEIAIQNIGIIYQGFSS